MRILAERLLAVEGGESTEGRLNAAEVVRVYEKLKTSLTRFAGSDGFTALMTRALSLARLDDPALDAISINEDGSIKGLEMFLTGSEDGGAEAVTALTTHLLDLLVTFIGEPLTHRLLDDAWPELDQTAGP